MFIEVLLPLALANSFSYRVPDEMVDDIVFGKRVIVPFGNKKIYTALIYKVDTEKPELVEPKDILMVMDNAPIVTEQQMKLWEWISYYYQCTLGEVYKAALPSGMKLESETMISAVDDFVAETQLKPKEFELIDILNAEKKPLSINDLSKKLNLKNCLPIVKRMMEMGAVSISEEVKLKYKPKTATYLMLAPEMADDEKLHSIFDALSKAPKQLNVLTCFLTLTNFMADKKNNEVAKKDLADKCKSDSAIKALIDKKILIAYEKEVGRWKSNENDDSQRISKLSEAQTNAYKEITKCFSEKDICLLHGVTSSGKTEIYIHLIEEVIKSGKQALFLLPEIALTTQITNRLRKVFGSQMGVYHSKFSDAERIDTWNNMLKGVHTNLILGVRSSIFLPFKNLGLIIVDEEHENSYKQYDPAPRYNARDCAMVLGNMTGAKVLLGSATPSIESYHLAKNGKYGLVELNTRFEGIQLPQIIVADIKDAMKKKAMEMHFTPELMEQMKIALKNKEQIILFQNRRGFSPYIQCKSCGYVPKCENCDVSLTYHKFTNILSCHYCGFVHPMLMTCAACGNPTMSTVGFGTEKIEEEVGTLFPEAKVARLDLDVAHSRNNFEKIIRDFENGDIDILVGTQMISKGLDFDKVRVVGILNADPMLNQPDFRANERAFQLMQQVSGRAGRHNKRGIVVIQTTRPGDKTILQVCQNAYKAMYNDQIAEREYFHYPPFFRLTYIYIKGKDDAMVVQAAEEMAKNLRAVFADRVYGPDRPTVTRIQNLNIRKIMLKVERSQSPKLVKDLVRDAITKTLHDGRFKTVFIYSDVDPA